MVSDGVVAPYRGKRTEKGASTNPLLSGQDLILLGERGHGKGRLARSLVTPK
jgi:hypothetical protein